MKWGIADLIESRIKIANVLEGVEIIRGILRISGNESKMRDLLVSICALLDEAIDMYNDFPPAELGESERGLATTSVTSVDEAFINAEGES